jgi:hypothetical protein
VDFVLFWYLFMISHVSCPESASIQISWLVIWQLFLGLIHEFLVSNLFDFIPWHVFVCIFGFHTDDLCGLLKKNAFTPITYLSGWIIPNIMGSLPFPLDVQQKNLFGSFCFSFNYLICSSSKFSILGCNIELFIDGFIILSISQETEAKKRKLQIMRQKKLTLMAEVR